MSDFLIFKLHYKFSWRAGESLGHWPFGNSTLLAQPRLATTLSLRTYIRSALGRALALSLQCSSGSSSLSLKLSVFLNVLLLFPIVPHFEIVIFVVGDTNNEDKYYIALSYMPGIVPRIV